MIDQGITVGLEVQGNSSRGLAEWGLAEWGNTSGIEDNGGARGKEEPSGTEGVET